MMLRDALARQGQLLFRWRSFLPLVLLPLLLVAFYHTGTIEPAFGAAVEHGWDGFCVVIGFLGLALRCAIVGFAPSGTSGRNTREQRADALNTTGLYSLVRHPLYLANFVMFVGMTLMVQVWWFTVIGVLAYWLYYERIAAAEEAFLERKFGRAYRDWARRTPAFVPRLKGWRRPALPFSWRTVLRREHHGFFLLVTVYTLIELVSDSVAERHWHLEQNWLAFFLAGAVTFLIVNQIKKRTRLLHVPGR
ncbi:MAG: isoprenylcysteine carboxylmethyltransferase family protein [Alphaproteobacteria bacterium]